jgi:anthranilate 1,2-dioxygenase large subunit
MEDTEATELVQRGTVRDGHEHSVIEMARNAPEQQNTLITENLIRSFWKGYRKLMDYPVDAPVAGETVA